MTSKNTALLDMPIAELVKEAYGKAEELKLSFPEISALLRAAAGRIDVFNALLVLSSSVNVQRYSPEYQMYMNHEMAYMRPTDNGTFVSLADYVALMKERNDLNNQMRELAAENAKLKSGVSFFSYDSDGGFDVHTTADDAIKEADSAIDYYRGNACDGWSEEVGSICWGVVIQSSTKVGERPRNEDDSCDPAIETICDYALLPSVETPATDAILREIRSQSRAEGIHFAANRLLAAWESGFVDDTPARAYDISGAILSALEFLPNADEGEFKRDYADEVRARIRAGEVQP